MPAALVALILANVICLPIMMAIYRELKPLLS
jgi:hypothetical protein